LAQLFVKTIKIQIRKATFLLEFTPKRQVLIFNVLGDLYFLPTLTIRLA